MRLRIPSIQMDPQATMATSIESPTGIKNDVEKIYGIQQLCAWNNE